jgi:hypothetical protein
MIFRPYLLRIHRWIALAPAIPLFIIIFSGLILSVEPLAQRSLGNVPLTADHLLGLLEKHDAVGKATGLSIRAYDRTLVIQGAGYNGQIEVDLSNGEEISEERP